MAMAFVISCRTRSAFMFLYMSIDYFLALMLAALLHSMRRLYKNAHVFPHIARSVLRIRSPYTSLRISRLRVPCLPSSLSPPPRLRHLPYISRLREFFPHTPDVCDPYAPVPGRMATWFGL